MNDNGQADITWFLDPLAPPVNVSYWGATLEN
jgi:hypothetical protein